MPMNNLKPTNSGIYNIVYHFAWSTKENRPLLETSQVQEDLGEVVLNLCEEHGYELKKLEVLPSQVHMFLSAPPKVAPSVIVKILKGATARILLTKHVSLKQEHGGLWNPKYYVGTIGDLSKEVVKDML